MQVGEEGTLSCKSEVKTMRKKLTGAERDRFCREFLLSMSPYSLDEATEATLKYARQNKFFPDVADITGGLAPVEPEMEEAKPDPAFGDYGCMFFSPCSTGPLRKEIGEGPFEDDC